MSSYKFLTGADTDEIFFQARKINVPLFPGKLNYKNLKRYTFSAESKWPFFLVHPNLWEAVACYGSTR